MGIFDDILAAPAAKQGSAAVPAYDPMGNATGAEAQANGQPVVRRRLFEDILEAPPVQGPTKPYVRQLGPGGYTFNPAEVPLDLRPLVDAPSPPGRPSELFKRKAGLFDDLVTAPLPPTRPQELYVDQPVVWPDVAPLDDAGPARTGGGIINSILDNRYAKALGVSPQAGMLSGNDAYDQRQIEERGANEKLAFLSQSTRDTRDAPLSEFSNQNINPLDAILEEQRRLEERRTGQPVPRSPMEQSPERQQEARDILGEQQRQADIARSKSETNEALKQKVDLSLGAGPSQSAGRNAVESGLAGIAGVPKGVADALLIVGKGISSPPFHSRKQFEDAAQSVDRFFSGLAKGDVTKTGDFSTKLSQGAGSTVGFAMAGVIGGALGLGAKATTMVAGALPQASQMYREAEAKGATETQKWLAFTAGLGIGASEAIPIARAMERWNLATRGNMGQIFRNMGVSAAEEGVQEAGQAVAENLAAKGIGYDPDRPREKDVLENALIGAITGAGFGGGGTAIAQGRNMLAERMAKGIQPDLAPEITPQISTDPAPEKAGTNEGGIPVVPDQATPDAPAQAAPVAPVQPEISVTTQAEAEADSNANDEQREAPQSLEPPARRTLRDIAAEDVAQLTGSGYTVDEIADMNRSERKAALEEADAAGVSSEVTDEVMATAQALRGDGSRQAPALVSSDADMDRAAQRVAVEPSEAQKDAGNYTKGHVEIAGLPVTIETPKGATRTGTTEDGQTWATEMPAHYGYIKRTKGADGEHIDTYIGPHVNSPQAYVVDQIDPKTGKFDEHKVILGARNEAEAKALYEGGFSDGSGSRRIGDITPMMTGELRWWTKNGDAKKPVGVLAKAVTPRAAPGIKGPLDLFQFLASRGGLRPDAELTNIGVDRAFVPALGRLVRKSGMTLDQAREAAVEAGYLNDGGERGGTVTQSFIDDLLQLIDRQARGKKVYSLNDTNEVLDREEERSRVTHSDPMVAAHYASMELDAFIDEMGLRKADIADQHYDMAVDLLAEGKETDPDVALERAFVMVESEAAADDSKLLPQEIEWVRTPPPAGWDEDTNALQQGRPPENGAVSDEGSADRADTREAGGLGEAGGNREAAGESRREKSLRPALTQEAGADGKPQTVIPGAEKASDRDQAKRKADEALKPKVAQKDTDGLSLFNDERKQGGLFDDILAAPKAEAKAEAKPEPAPSPVVINGASNTIFTADKADAARTRLKAKLSGTQVNSGIDPEAMLDGLTIAGFHIEAGARSFAAYTKAMVDDLGEAVRPYLRGWYENVRHYPGFDSKGMSSTAEIDKATSVEPSGAKLNSEVISPNGTDAKPDRGVRAPAQELPAKQQSEAVKVAGEGRNPEPALQGNRPESVRDDASPDRANDERADPANRLPAKGEGTRSDSADSGRDRTARSDLPAAATVTRSPASKGRAEAQKAIASRSKLNYRITADDRLGAGSPREKINANIKAIELAKEIASEGRQATEEEKKILVRYTGFGAFAQKLFTRNSEFAQESKALSALLMAEEYDAARASTLNAHYTSEDVIKGMWAAAEHLGFKGGIVLEPAAGAGHFIGLTPDALRSKTAWTGVELDPVTGLIASQLYAGSDMNVTGFEKLDRPDNYYDMAISNVPFGQYGIVDRRYGNPNLSIHNYFFVKALDKVRPGGVVAFITSRYTMDSAADRARALINQRGDFIGAVRLPGGSKGAFAGNAGTEVTTDIIFIRKRGKNENTGFAQPWGKLNEIQTPEGPTLVNEYFAANPQMMLGEARLVRGQFSDADFQLVGSTTDLETRIADAVKGNIQGDIMTVRAGAVETLAAADIDVKVKEGSIFEKDGSLFRRVRGVGVAVPMTATDADKAKRLIAIRESVTGLLREQAAGKPKDGDKLRAKLKRDYEAFVKTYGPINLEVTTTTKRMNKRGDAIAITKEPNVSMFSRDPDVYAVRSIENYDRETGEATPAAIFERDIISQPVTPTIASAQDALAVILDRAGQVDIDRMAEMLGRSADDVVLELGDGIYKNPDGEVYQTADEYLSGNVVQKLRDAQVAAKLDPDYARNVKALEQNQPIPLTRLDIHVPIGAPWVSDDVYTAFAREVLGGGDGSSITRNKITGDWNIKLPTVARDAVAKFATDRAGIPQVLGAALNRTSITIYDKGEGDKPAVNQAATEAARIRVQALSDAFSGAQERGVDGWIWAEDERSKYLEGTYNEVFNSTVTRKFDGSHQTFPGLASHVRSSNGEIVPFVLRPHQKNAIWRNVQTGNTLFAHVVGAGKTFTMIASGMEMKRLGLVRKPMFAVPNHMLEQFSREFLQAYPAAKVLVANKEETTKDERGAFVAKSAAGDWDAIVMTHDAFGRIGVSPDWVAGYVRNQIAEAQEAMDAANRDEGKKSPSVKQIEKTKKSLEAQLEKLLATDRKDDGVTFEQMGVDHLFVDEGHLFKNLSFVTKMTRVKGLAQGSSQRAEDLFLKTRLLEQRKPGRSLTMATGTPLSNTMAEMFTMQRYLQLDRLQALGIDKFDAWASTFGQTVTQMEMAPDGRSFQENTSFSKFLNVPELISIYSEVADTQTADMLNLPRPQLKMQPDGKRGITAVEAEPNSMEESYIQSLVERAAEVKGKRVEKGGDNMLKIVSEGRKVATDFRLIDPRSFINSDGKIAKAVDNIERIWRDGKAPGLTQMVFLDMGVPNAKNQQVQSLNEGDPDDLLDADSPFNPADIQGGFDLYSDIKSRLIDKGIPSDQIAFIHDANDDGKKAKLFHKVRAGEVRVLIGSTGKMGVGTNVQDRLIAMHHLDAPWKPAEVEQRDGRIIRQGNMNPEVEIYRYVTKRSFDAFMWQKLETKAKFIAQVTSGAKGIRTAEDIDSPLPEAAEMKAAASGDPRILEFVNLDRQLMELSAQRRGYESQRLQLKASQAQIADSLSGMGKQLDAIEADAAKVQDISGDKFSVDLKGIGKGQFAKREDAGAAILKNVMANRNDYYRPKDVMLGKIAGVDFGYLARLQYLNGESIPIITPIIKGDMRHEAIGDIPLSATSSAAGLMRRFENLVQSVASKPDVHQARIAKAIDELARVKKSLAENQTFPQETTLRDVQKRHAELKEALAAKAKPPSDAADEAKPDPERRASALRSDVDRTALNSAITEATQIIRRVAGPSVSIQFFEKMSSPIDDVLRASGATGEGIAEYAGHYSPAENLIAVSLSPAFDPDETAHHEAFHALQSAGVMSEQEIAVLKRSRPDMERVIAQGYGASLQAIAQMPQYEIEAYAYALYATQRDGGAQTPLSLHIGVRRAFDKVWQFFQALRNALAGRGFLAYQGVFKSAERGDMAGRQQMTAGVPFFDPAASFLSRLTGRKKSIENAGAGQTPAVALMPGLPVQPKEFVAPDGTGRAVKAARAIQDEFVDLRRIQSAVEEARGAPLPESVDAYLAQSLFPGRTTERIEDFRKGQVEPLIAEMRQRGVKFDEMNDYLYARHAPERNERIAAINESLPDGGSGMTNAEAAAIMEGIEASGRMGDFQALASRVDDIIKGNIETRRAAGLENDETSDGWLTNYKHYVPLRGFAEGSNDSPPRVGKGFDIRGKEYQQALGRRSKAASPLSNAILQAEEGIVRAEKNRAGKAMLRLARANPIPELWEVNRKVSRRVIDAATGLVKTVVDTRESYQADNVLAVKVGGETYYLTLHDEGLAKAYKKLGATNLPPLMQGAAKFGRIFSQLQTSRNPEFFTRNVIRDFQEAGFTAFAQSPKMAAAFMKNYVPAMRAAAQIAMGQRPEKWAELHDEWRQSGGKIGYNAFRDLDEIGKEIKRDLGEIDESNLKRLPKEMVRRIFKAMDGLNDVFESGTRLAAHASAKEMGFTKDKAAAFARESTVNFNRRGSLTPWVNGLYIFFNASVQGNAKLLDLVINSKRARLLYAGMLPLGIAATFLNRAVSDDDKDEKRRKFYDGIPLWERQKNFIIMTGGKSYIKIPMAFGLGIPFMLGESIAMTMMGAVKPAKAAGNMIWGVADAFNPLGQGSLLNMLAPTLVDPLVDLYANKDWRGRDIAPASARWNEGVPKSSQYAMSASPQAVTVAQAINKVTGGDRFKPGAIDLFPAHVEYAVGWATGGLGRFALNGTRAAMDGWQGVPTPMEKMPIVRSFIGADPRFGEQARFYEIRKESDETRARISTSKKALDADPKDIEAKATFEKEAGEFGVRQKGSRLDWTRTPAGVFSEADKQIKELRLERQAAINSTSLNAKQRAEKTKEIEGRMRVIMNAARRDAVQMQPALAGR